MSRPKTYLIPAGSHTAKNRIPMPFIGRSLTFLVTFDQSAVYTAKVPENQYDINKLYGFSESWNPHENSARFGWTYAEGKLKLWVYVYINGARVSKELCTIEAGVTYKCMIAVEKNRYTFTVLDTRIFSIPVSSQTIRGKAGKRAFGYMMFPYFGGQEVPDHDVTITIQRL